MPLPASPSPPARASLVVLPWLVRSDIVGRPFARTLMGDQGTDEMGVAFLRMFRAQDFGPLVPVLQAMVDENRYPQLGAIEIGGWDKMNYWRNPPPHLREREAARFPKWMTQVALSLPKLELLRTEVRALGTDTWRVRMAVANSGWLPAYVSQRALQRKVVRGVMFEIALPEGDATVSLVSGKPRMEGPQLEGHAPKQSQIAFLPSREVTADRAVAEWVDVVDLTWRPVYAEDWLWWTKPGKRLESRQPEPKHPLCDAVSERDMSWHWTGVFDHHRRTF